MHLDLKRLQRNSPRPFDGHKILKKLINLQKSKLCAAYWAQKWCSSDRPNRFFDNPAGNCHHLERNQSCPLDSCSRMHHHLCGWRAPLPHHSDSGVCLPDVEWTMDQQGPRQQYVVISGQLLSVPVFQWNRLFGRPTNDRLSEICQMVGCSFCLNPRWILLRI